MYLRIFILFIVSASAIDSDFTLPFEDTLGQDALSFDQMTLDSNPLDSSWDSTSLDSSSLDSTAPLFGADTSSTDDALNGFDLSDSSDFFSGDDPFQLADCSTSEIPSAVGKLRVKRADDGASCSNPSGTGDSNQPPLLIPQEYDPEHHSITCWELTLGFLPFAVASSGDGVDITRDGSTMTRIPSTRIQFTPSTLYRATISMHTPQ